MKGTSRKTYKNNTDGAARNEGGRRCWHGKGLRIYRACRCGRQNKSCKTQALQNGALSWEHVAVVGMFVCEQGRHSLASHESRSSQPTICVPFTCCCANMMNTTLKNRQTHILLCKGVTVAVVIAHQVDVEDSSAWVALQDSISTCMHGVHELDTKHGYAAAMCCQGRMANFSHSYRQNGSTRRNSGCAVGRCAYGTHANHDIECGVCTTNIFSHVRPSGCGSRLKSRRELLLPSKIPAANVTMRPYILGRTPTESLAQETKIPGDCSSTSPNMPSQSSRDKYGLPPPPMYNPACMCIHACQTTSLVRRKSPGDSSPQQ